MAELDKLAKRLKGPNAVKVGLPKGSNDYPDGTSVILVGLVHEFGSPTNGVPARSFLRSTLRDNKAKYKRLFNSLSRKMASGQLTRKKALGIIGLQFASDVQSTITSIKTPPLKHREGNPLLDTGHLRQSITYQVED